MSQSHIRIRGARTHNLKNVNLDIPRDKFVVITGLSGSGKSSLAFDTLCGIAVCLCPPVPLPNGKTGSRFD